MIPRRHTFTSHPEENVARRYSSDDRGIGPLPLILHFGGRQNRSDNRDNFAGEQAAMELSEIFSREISSPSIKSIGGIAMGSPT